MAGNVIVNAFYEAFRIKCVYWDVNVAGLSPSRFAPRKLFGNEPSNAHHKPLSETSRGYFLALSLLPLARHYECLGSIIHHPPVFVIAAWYMAPLVFVSCTRVILRNLIDSNSCSQKSVYKIAIELQDKVHEVVEVLHGLLISPMKRHHAFVAFVELRQVAGRLLENHEGNKLEFYDHLNRIGARVRYGGGVKPCLLEEGESQGAGAGVGAGAGAGAVAVLYG
ncbi:LOW QUALITY PROTEIN: hypothetical protein V1478_003986 [Vespula squamosa]|uniref:Uncharacterized protein n=1 Tax=Vespula squamosa TaxID=30214 RepID=A0ABD2BND2_VESSQ